MCNIERPGDVCDCIMQAIEISKEGSYPLNTKELNETIYRTVQVARESAQKQERQRILSEIDKTTRKRVISLHRLKEIVGKA